jgi:xanthine/uracil permease
MLWLFAAVVLACAILSPRFRRVLLITAAVLAAIVAGAPLWDKSEESEEHPE